MRILHFIPAWSIGGAERVINELIINYPSEFKATIATFKIIGREDHIKNLKIIKTGRIKKYISFLKYVFSYKPDILHAHMTPTIPLLIMLRFINWKIKIIYTVHGEYHKPGFFALRMLDYIFFTKCNIKIVCVSEFTFNSIKKYWNIKHLVILNGISPIMFKSTQQINKEIETLKKSSQTKIFLSIARIVPVKNLELLITAFNKFSSTHDVILIIVGFDPNSKQEELIKLKRIATGNVYFLGAQLCGYEYLAFADAFCLSSISEALPITILESFSCAVPVISTNVGGIPEIVVNGINGFLSNDLSVTNYEKILTNFISLSDNEIKNLKINLLKRYDELFTSKKMYLQYLSIYNNAN